MPVPNIFGTATSAIPLSQLDTNFATPVTIGNTAVQLGNTVTSFGNVTLTNVTISSGNVTVSAGSNTAPSITTVGDTNTGIFFPAADTIAFSEGGVESARIDASGNMGLGVTPSTVNTLGGYKSFEIGNIGNGIYAGTNQTLFFTNTKWDGGTTKYAQSYEGTLYNQQAGTHQWLNAASGTAGNTITYIERARIDLSGNLLVGKNATTFSAAGSYINSAGKGVFTVDNDEVMLLNRLTSDGNIIRFYQATTEEGNISITGNTTNYNPFLGSHSGALADWSRSEIKIGTVMDTIDELLEYKVVVINVQEKVSAKDAVIDEEGNEVQPAQVATTQTIQKRISYNGNGAIGSSATVEYEGQEYTGIINNEREKPYSFNKHLKVKINDTAASKAIFGVFVGWNTDKNNDGGVYNDMLVGAVGNYVIRMAAGQEPQIGDLVEADGNGCAVVQDDDIIRTKTVAKVTSTIQQVTYDDGSFLVTCVLYCG